MRRSILSSVQSVAALLIAFAASQLESTATAAAQETPAPGPEGAVPKAEAATSDAVTLSTPAMAGSLVTNPQPMNFDAGPLGKVYMTGAASGVALFETNKFPSDRSALLDLTSAQVFVQKIDGLVQFYAQAGAYSVPELGTPYLRAGKATSAFFSPLPLAYLKLAPTENFSVQVGKLPTLIGAENTFTYQNANIQRGLLWNQENAIYRGLQANYTAGPVAFIATLNDGFYSGRYTWLWGSAAWTIDNNNSLTFAGGGNFARTPVTNVATPLAQNNGDLFTLVYNYTNAPWTITPYLQATFIPRDTTLGLNHRASTYGAALLVNYGFNDQFHLLGRAEYIASTGSLANGAPNLLYGPGSSAWSLTLTPTYQQGIFFIRGEASYVQAMSATPGFAFGRNGRATSQGRLMIETGVLF
jgi:hypothetical protein